MQNKYSHTPLMGTQIGTIALKKSLEVSVKSECIHTLWPQNSTLRFILSRNLYMHAKRHRCVERTFGLRGRGRGRWWDDLGEWHCNRYTIM